LEWVTVNYQKIKKLYKKVDIFVNILYDINVKKSTMERFYGWEVLN